MNDLQSRFIKKILAGVSSKEKVEGKAFAPANIALCKYWGKRNADLNLPMNSSLSVSLGQLGSHTVIRKLQATDAPILRDSVFLNHASLAPETPFSVRVSNFLDLFRGFLDGSYFEVRTVNTIPTAAGLASSASGFAALALAIDDLAGWGLARKKLSMLARLGSGSASRSVYDGFVQWNRGTKDDGSDSFAEKVAVNWSEFRVGILELCSSAKKVGSREGMQRTLLTSSLYASWPNQAEADLIAMRDVLSCRDFAALGQLVEQNALSMHATMMSAWPPLIYLQPNSLEAIQKVHCLRHEGVAIYLTIDAGPNIKLLFLEGDAREIKAAFPGVQIVSPFGGQEDGYAGAS